MKKVKFNKNIILNIILIALTIIMMYKVKVLYNSYDRYRVIEKVASDVKKEIETIKTIYGKVVSVKEIENSESHVKQLEVKISSLKEKDINNIETIVLDKQNKEFNLKENDIVSADQIKINEKLFTRIVQKLNK